MRDTELTATAAWYRNVRGRSLMLAQMLSDEDCGAQSMPDASPVKWHLAHTTWFFETFVLEPHEAGFRPFHPAFRYLFNSYYNGIGERHPRAERGLLTRPAMREVRDYRSDVDARVCALLEQAGARAALADLVALGLQHEQQHQELLLTDVKHLLSRNAMLPAYANAALAPAPAAAPLAWRTFEGGLADIGFAGEGFCFDNELPRHRQYVAPYALASRLVTNGEYLAFMDAGGYRNPALWLAEGWDHINTNRLTHPLYWRRDEAGQWHEFTLHGEQALDLARPVVHLSLYEAAACAQFMNARLPTEAEWELAAALHTPGHGNLHPAGGGAADGLSQLFGHCWQWTSSSYAPYPGYACTEGALGEYNGKFMLNQYVLRGSSCATPPGHARASYRNFFPAAARWQFTGLRLAR